MVARPGSCGNKSPQSRLNPAYRPPPKKANMFGIAISGLHDVPRGSVEVVKPAMRMYMRSVPNISVFSPRIGPSAGGFQIMLWGSHLRGGSDYRIAFVARHGRRFIASLMFHTVLGAKNAWSRSARRMHTLTMNMFRDDWSP